MTTPTYTAGPIPTNLHLPPLVVGLYSFPKSGNTWLRAIVCALTGMPSGPGTMQQFVTDSHFGPVIDNPWPFHGRDWYFYKSHSRSPLREHMGQTFDTDKIVHIWRHPLDVFVSYLNFVSGNVSPAAGKSLPVQFDKVESLTPAEFETLFAIFLEHATLFPQNRKFGNVFDHVKNYRALGLGGRSVLGLRYEDLIDDFDSEVSRLCDFLGMRGIDIARIFAEVESRTKQNGKFFWKRRKENFRDFLSADQIDRFNRRYSTQMRSLGYAD